MDFNCGAFAGFGIFYIPDSLNAFLASACSGLMHGIFSVFLFNKGIVSNFIHINLAWILSVAALFAFKYFLLEKDRRLIKIFFPNMFPRTSLMKFLIIRKK